MGTLELAATGRSGRGAPRHSATARAGRWPALSASAVALLVGSCSADYRFTLKPVPDNAQTLQVASYVNGAIALQAQPFKIGGDVSLIDSSYSFGLNQKPESDGTVHVSVGALDAGQCLLAVGSIVEEMHTNVNADNDLLQLYMPDPKLIDCPTMATPSIIDIRRTIQGSFSSESYTLTIQGWGFLPNAKVEIRSAAVVRCTADAKSQCASLCDTTNCANYDGNTGSTAKQYCNCALQFTESDIEHQGPATIVVTLRSAPNQLESGSIQEMRPPIGLADLVSRPLTVTVTNSSTEVIKQTEADQVVGDMAGAAGGPTADMGTRDL